MEDAVTVTNAAGTNLNNLLTQSGSFTEADATAFFDDARKQQITGIAAGGGASTLDGATPADQLLQSKRIQTYKIIFHKLAKSLTSTFEKQVIPEMNKMEEDRTRLLYHIIKITMSTTATAYISCLIASLLLLWSEQRNS